MTPPVSYRDLVLRGGPQLFVPFDEPSGTTAADASGYARNGTGAGSPVRAVSGALSDGTVATRLDGVDDGFTFGDVIDFGVDDWSIEFWIKTSATPTEQGIIGKYHTSTPWRPFWEIMLTDDGAEAGKIRAGIDDGSGAILSCYGPNKVNDGAWHYVCVVFDRDQGITVFTDGDARFQAGKRQLSMDAGGVLRVGGNGAEAGPRIACDIGQLAAYKYALSDEQARARNVWGRLKLPVVVADPDPASIECLAPVSFLEIDFERDLQRQRYRRAVIADSPTHYYPFDGTTQATLLDDIAGGTAVDLTQPGVLADQTLVRLPASGATVDRGAPNPAWTNPGNIVAEDAVFATATLGSVVSDWLEATFTGVQARIPEGATITGYSVRVKAKQSAAGPGGSVTVQVIDAAGTSNQKTLSTALTSTNTNLPTFGSSSDMWGQTGVTRDTFADPVKVQISVGFSSGSQTASVDVVELTVYFHTTKGTDGYVVDTTHKLGETANDKVAVSPYLNGLIFDLDWEEWSVEFWLKPFTTAPIADQTVLNNTSYLSVTYRTDGKLRTQLMGSGSLILDTPLALGTVWHHYVLTVSATKIRVYLDGEEIGSLDVPEDQSMQITSGAINTQIGGNFSGRFDELATYGYELDPTRPKIHFRAGPESDATTERFQSITSRVRSFAWQFVRSGTLGAMQAAELRATVDNSDQALEPDNPSSPFYPNVRDNRPCRQRDRWPGNFAEDPSFKQAIGAEWTATQTLGTVTAQTSGQSPPVGGGTARVVAAVRNAASSASFLSVTMIDRIPVEPMTPITVSFYAKKTGTPSPKISVRMQEIDSRNRNHGARSLTAVAAPAASGEIYPSAADATTGWQRYAATFIFPRSIAEAILELVLIDTPTTTGALTVYATGVQVEYGGATHGFAAGQWWENFTGEIESFPSSTPTHRRARVELVANDGRAGLQSDTVRGSVPTQLTGARIGVLLDRGLWRTDKRLLDAGVETLAADKYTAAVAADGEISKATDSELGLFFIDGSARAVFHDGGHRNRVARSSYARARFGDGDETVELPYVSVERDSGGLLIRNDVRVTAKGGDDKAKDETKTLDFAGVPGLGTLTADVTVVGAKPGDAVTATPSGHADGLVWNAYVPTPDTVRVVVSNFTGGDLDTSVSWHVQVTPEPGITDAQIATDYLSQVRHRIRKLPRSTLLASPTAAKSQSETLLARFREARSRFTRMLVEPARDPRLWPVILDMQINDLYTIARRATALTEREYRDMILTDQPSAYWMLEEIGGNGIAIVDEIGRTSTVPNGLSAGVAVNGVDLSASPLRGRLGCRSLDGTGDYVTVGDLPALRWLGSLTWEAWIKPDDLAARRVIMAKAIAGEGSLAINTDGTLRYRYGTSGNDGGTNQTATSTGAVTAAAWHHVAVVRDLSLMQIRFYIDGVLAGTVAASYATPVASTLAFALGHGGDGSDFKGAMAHAAAYPFVLAADRILERHKAAAKRAGQPGDDPVIANAWIEGIIRTTELQPNLRTSYALSLGQ